MYYKTGTRVRVSIPLLGKLACYIFNPRMLIYEGLAGTAVDVIAEKPKRRLYFYYRVRFDNGLSEERMPDEFIKKIS